MTDRLAVSTDAHSTTDFELIRFGVDQARRGWLEPDDVLSTRLFPLRHPRGFWRGSILSVLASLPVSGPAYG